MENIGEELKQLLSVEKGLQCRSALKYQVAYTIPILTSPPSIPLRRGIPICVSSLPSTLHPHTPTFKPHIKLLQDRHILFH